MNSSANHSVSSIVRSWIVNPKVKQRSNSTTEREYISEEMSLVCMGADKNCKLMYNSIEDEFVTMYDCHRGSLCTEFRIMKEFTKKNSTLNSKDSLVKDFSVFRSL